MTEGLETSSLLFIFLCYKMAEWFFGIKTKTNQKHHCCAKICVPDYSTEHIFMAEFKVEMRVES